MMAAKPRLEASLIPRENWQEFDLWESTGIKIKDQDGKGACFPDGTRVRMADGTEKPIQDVKLLDWVVTAEGNTGKVVRTFVREFGPELLRLNLWGHSHLRLTPNHEVLTKRGYVRADELNTDDWVALPRYAPESRRFILTDDHVQKRALAATPQGSKGGYWQVHEDRCFADFPDVIESTPGAGRIIGLYLAEGSGETSGNRATWTFGEDERDTLVSELTGLLGSEWGLEATVKERPERNTIVVRLSRSPWAKLLASLCGAGSSGLRLHADLLSAPRDFLASMLSAWLDGDGHARRSCVEGVTISRDLALGMYDVAQLLGRRPSIRRYQSRTYGSVKTRQARWEVTLANEPKNTYRCLEDATHVWRRVREVEREAFQGNVFNIEVEGDHSYVAEGVGVHNCNGHAAATSLECARWVAGAPNLELSAWYVYAILCGGIDRGSNIGDALQLLSKQGTCLDSSLAYATINPGRISSDAKTEASRFKIEIGEMLTTPDELMTAIQRRQPMNLAVAAGPAFSRLDADGIPGMGMFCNHAITCFGGAKKARDGRWLIKMINSWSEKWGQNGCCWLPVDELPRHGGFEAYTVLAAIDDPQDKTRPLPPVAVI